jgi:lipoteichoic acid synthase
LRFILSLIFFTIYLTERGTVPPSRAGHPFTPALLTLIAGVCAASIAHLSLPGAIRGIQAADISEHGRGPQSPIASLATTVYLKYRAHVKSDAYPLITDDELDLLKEMGFHYNRQTSYPLVKEQIYTGDAPFPLRRRTQAGSPNIIVIFSEGLSARAIGAYGSIYSDLTPHIDDFSRQSMIVTHYYNHTAATYRGLHGQLASIFPYYGGVGGWHSKEAAVSGRSYLTIADLFRQRNYETIFLDSHHKKHRSRVDEMMTELGFETVLTGDELADKFLDGEAPLENMAYSDQQYFDTIIGYLEKRLHSGGTIKPFFMSLYNFGTHAFLGQSKDGQRYHSHNNVVLNNTHNFDYAFGRLWNYIQESPYNKDTVIVFTSDHCHFYEPAFLNAFSEPDYEQKFIDQIPLIIWDPLRLLPARYDARNASSVDFAPTLAHYFGLDNVPNPFMGISIFENERRLQNQRSVAALGPHEIYLIEDTKIHQVGDEGVYEPILKVLDKYISIVRQLELENRIWDDGLLAD